jgi:hypothetical protein
LLRGDAIRTIFYWIAPVFVIPRMVSMNRRIFPNAGFRAWLSLSIVLTLAIVAEPLVPQVRHAGLAHASTLSISECGDANGDSAILATDALVILVAAVSGTIDCNLFVCDVIGGLDGVTATDALAVLSVAVGVTEPSILRCPTAARVWMEELLNAIRLDTPRPTVHARNLFHLSVAMWDVWVAYDQSTDAVPYLTVESPTPVADPLAARSEAITYAAYRLLEHRFAGSPNSSTTFRSIDARMAELGCDRFFTSTDGDSPAALGNRVAAAVIAYGSTDGSNEANDYADTTGYAPVNAPMIVELPGTEMVDPNRWQPLSLEFFIAQNGIPLPIDVQEFISPNWDLVAPFALVRAGQGIPYVDPGLPPQLGGQEDAEFKDAVLEVLRHSSRLDPDDEVTIDIAPSAHGNNPLGTEDGSGWPVNPATGQPYAPNIVKRGDWGRILAEFWADGPDSETPPGHWNVLANYVSDHPLVVKQIGGTGAVLDSLEWDVKTYLAMNGAVHDAAVAAWGAKAIYDYVRPISMIRYMGVLGQSSEPGSPAYHPDGLLLEPGLVEILTAETTAAGQRHEALAGAEGEIAIYAWLGNPSDPENDYSGVGWIRAVEWVPYQRETFVTPAFAAYVSGHSAFSRAGAEVLTRMTGSEYFPGGIGTFLAPKDVFLAFEIGPTEDITLEWATYQDAADEAGVSRLWGGIHVRADDFRGRIMGFQIGQDAYDLAESYWNGVATTISVE